MTGEEEKEEEKARSGILKSQAFPSMKKWNLSLEPPGGITNGPVTPAYVTLVECKENGRTCQKAWHER